MWTERYRPKSLTDVVNLKNVVVSLKAFLETPSTIPHLLFTGRPGTGKTAIALCITRELFGSNWRSLTLELNASDDRGIKMIRDRVKNFSRYNRGSLTDIPFGIVILDECDQMTTAAQTALRRIMETSSRTSRFILIANYSSKIIEPLQSRCAIFRFHPLKQEDMAKRIRYIAEKEKINLAEEAVGAIIEFSYGDLRRAINLLQTSAVFNNDKNISYQTVINIVGQTDPKYIQIMLNKALGGEFIDARERLYDIIIKQGISGIDIIKQIHRELYKIPNLSTTEKADLVRIVGEYDFRISEGANDDIQLSALLAQLVKFGKNRMSK
jgi:replication factor C small subunit